MFWKMRMQPPSALDDLLASDSCTLEEVLDEENVVDELRSNRALLDFLTRQDILSGIVTLVIEEPPDDLEESVRYRRPYVACNLFSLEQSSANALADSVVADESLLDRLWSFLDQPAPLNPLLASFFSRVLLSLLQRKAVVMIEYLSSRSGSLDQLLGHIDTSAIMDLILGMLSACDSSPLRRDLIQWFRDAQLVKSLVDLVRPSVDEDKQRNAARTLSELVRLCYDHLARSSDVLHSDQLLDILEHDDTIQQLLHNVLVENTSASPIVRGVSVLQSMLTLQQGLTDQSTTDTPVVANEEAARQVVGSLTPWLAALHRLLLEPPPSRPVLTTVGTIAVPVGPARLGIVQLILLCLQSKVPEFLHEFVRLNVGPTLLDLFFEYMWNNFLHTQVEQLTIFAFGSKMDGIAGTGGGDAVQDTSLTLSLVSTYKLTEKLAAAGIGNDEEKAAGGRRRGYMGHVVSMSNSLLHAMEGDSHVAAAVEAVCAEDGSRWKEWVDGGLAESNKRNNTALGGQQMDDDPDDMLTMESTGSSDSIHQAFLNYQSEQLSTEFANSFGFDEERLSDSEAPVTASYDEACAMEFDLVADMRTSEEDLFEVCCASRIEQFGEIPEFDNNWLSSSKAWKPSSSVADSESNKTASEPPVRESDNVASKALDAEVSSGDDEGCVVGTSGSTGSFSNSNELDDTVVMEEGDMDDEALGNFEFLSSGLMKSKGVEVSDIRADAEAAMKEFEEVTGMAVSA